MSVIANGEHKQMLKTEEGRHSWPLLKRYVFKLFVASPYPASVQQIQLSRMLKSLEFVF